MAPIVAALIPTIVQAISSPAVAGTAAAWLAKRAGLPDASIDAVTRWMEQIRPEDRVRLRELDLEFQKYVLGRNNERELAELGLIRAQIDVNREEARSTRMFIAGWRPFVGWTCGCALAYASIVEPVARFAAQVGFGYAGAFPAIDTALTLQVLVGLLGLGTLRTYEKARGSEGNR